MDEERKEGRSSPISFRMPDGLFLRMDHFIEKHEYSGYPEFIKSAVRHYLDYLEGLESGRIRQFVVPNEPPEVRKQYENRR